MLLRESLGISADASNKAFPSTEVDAFLARRMDKLPHNGNNIDHQTNTKHFLLAVDPSGGGSSAFAITSILQDGLGRLVVRTTHRAARTHRPVVSNGLSRPHLRKHT